MQGRYLQKWLKNLQRLNMKSIGKKIIAIEDSKEIKELEEGLKKLEQKKKK